MITPRKGASDPMLRITLPVRTFVENALPWLERTWTPKNFALFWIRVARFGISGL